MAWKAAKVEIQGLSELQTPDDRALLFGPWGLSTGGTLDPEFAATYQQEVIAGADLADEVPQRTRSAFEQLRRLHSHGVLLYDAYTIVSSQAPFVLELALRERFVAFYRDEGVPLVHGNNRRRTLPITSFADFKQRDLPEANRELEQEVGQGSKWKLAYKSVRRMRFGGNFTELLQWARNVSLLHGQRNRAIESAIADLRNHAAHPEGYSIVGPGESRGMIWDAAEIINRLWGADTEGGRLYPAPLGREVMAIGWGGDTGGTVTFYAGDPEAREPGGSKTYVVVRAVPHDPDLHQYSTRFEKTTYPAEFLFGPATWGEARDWILTNEPTADAVDYLDRTFVVRERNEHVERPRSPEVAAALPADERSGTWHLLRADHPNAAYNHVRGPGGTRRGDCAQTGPCKNCRVEVLGRGPWEKVVREHGCDPLPLPDIDIPSPWD